MSRAVHDPSRKLEVVPATGELTPDDARRALVQRIAASSHFQKSPKLREFLQYVCERALANQPEQINEQLIGCRVFGRRADYNSNEDNIVRVEARQLRKRLEDFFAQEGAAEPLVIRIPKGGYVPVFETRQDTLPATPPPELEASLRTARRRTVRFAVLSAALAVVCLWLLFREAGLQTDAATAQLRRLLWSKVFDANHQTYLVVADSNLVLLQDIIHRPVTLNEYLGRDYPRSLKGPAISPEVAALMDLISSRQYTSLADADLTAKILQLSGGFSDRVVIRFARNLQIRDFKSANVILLGSRRANPWAELLETQLNFEHEVDERSRRSYFRNKAPRSGEPREYWFGGPDGKSTETYAVVALIPNLSRTGTVLIVAGATMEGTEAAGEVVTNGELFLRLIRAMGVGDNPDRIPYFEALLKTSSTAGAPRDSAVIAYRILAN